MTYYNGSSSNGGGNQKAIPLVNGKYDFRQHAVAKGNVCAFVPAMPPQYKKLNVKHWPSQDYVVRPPKGFTHKDLTTGQELMPNVHHQPNHHHGHHVAYDYAEVPFQYFQTPTHKY